MNCMKKTGCFSIIPLLFSVFLLCFVLFQGINLQVYATQTPPVMDFGNLLTASEEQELEVEIQRLVNKTGFGFGIILYDEPATYSNFLSYIKNDVGATYYQSNRFIMALNLTTREMILEVNGTARDEISDAQSNLLVDKVAPYFSRGDYYGGMSLFLELIESHLASPSGSSSLSSTTEQKATILFFSFVMSLAVAGSTTYFFWQSMNTVRDQDSASEYLKKEKFSVTHNQERYLSRTVIRTPIQQNNPGGGGHGGGRSSGGVSRGF